MATLYWTENDDDPCRNRDGCRATLNDVSDAELQLLLSLVPSGDLDEVDDDTKAVAAVQRALSPVIGYDVRGKIEVPRFVELKAQLTRGARGVAFARLVVLRDL